MVRRRYVFLAALVLVLTALPGAAAATSPAATVFVPADASWVSTGVIVESGHELSISAHGQAITGPLVDFPGARSGPDGQAFTCPDPGGPEIGCNRNGEPYGALVGKIGTWTFFVGSSHAATVPVAGELMLAVNDNLGFHFDNHGGFAVQVRTN